jgi:FkbM family methyltransferase
MARTGLRMRCREAVQRWWYSRHAKCAQTLRFDQEELRALGFFIQCGQDRWITEYFGGEGMRPGVFVDVGAHDGMTFSNTLLLEKKFGWTGIAVEPIPEVFERLRANRGCVTVNGCVAGERGPSEFQIVTGYSEMLSGRVETYDPRHLKRIDRELETHGGERRTIAVECFRLNELLADNAIKHVDYLSIDTEGGELEILRSLDFQSLSLSIIGVENNYRDPRIPEFLVRRGYRFHSIVGDEFYVRTPACP